MTDASVIALGDGCSHLQSIKHEGCRRVAHDHDDYHSDNDCDSDDNDNNDSDNDNDNDNE